MIVRQALNIGWEFVLNHYVACAVGLFVGYLASCGWRNKYQHPLRRFPGPLLGGATDFYHLALFASKKVHITLFHLHKKHGHFVRVAPNLLSISDPSLLRQIYSRNADKTPFYSAGMAGEQAPLLQVQDNQEHAMKLRSLGPTYSLRHIRQLENVVDDQIIRTMHVFASRFAATNRRLDIAEYTRWHVYDTMTQLIYGQPTKMVEQGRDIDGLISQWHIIFSLGGLLATLPWLIKPIVSAPILKTVLMPQKGHWFGSGYIMSAHERLFARSLKRPDLAHSANLMDSLLRSRNARGEIMTKSEAEHECFILQVGSQDTSASFISAFVDFMLKNDEARQTLLNEIKEFDNQHRLSLPVATYDETVEMTYFMACVSETLRLSPSVSMILPRYSPEGGIFIDDTWVPPGVELAANPYIIHRNKDIFGEDADVFRPHRWIDCHPSQLALMKKFFLAFGYGSRRCLGKNIALFESQKFLIELFRNFDVKYENPKKPFLTENWGINMYFEQNILLRSR